MDLPLTLLDLAGAVALLLWGVHMVQTGVQRAFGARLRAFLGQALRGRARAFMAGIGVTALLQSSTATGLMVTGFAAGGLVELVPSLAVMLGANVGTTLIVQLLSFNVAAIAPGLILAGVVMFRRSTAGRRDLGRVLIGLGLLLMALHQFVAILQPYEQVPTLRVFLAQISTQPLLDVVLAAGLTWAAHSSVAVVLLIISFTVGGVVPIDAAFALVLGANLGTAINPVLEGGAGHDPAARRLPFGNLLNRALGVSVALIALPWITPILLRLDPHDARVIADFHTLFNFILAVVFFPLLTPYAALLRRLLPARLDASDPGLPIYLDPAAREAPVVALGGAAREALRLADILEAMLQGLRDALVRGDRRQIDETKTLDDVLDRLNAAIKSYVTGLDAEALSTDDQRRVAEILTFATHLEHAGDVIERNLLVSASKKLKAGLQFSAQGEAELLAILDRVLANARCAAALFVNEDVRAARLLAQEKSAFRTMESEATNAHFERLRRGELATRDTSSLHLDVVRDLKRVNAHLVAAAAYPVLERMGDLLPSRLRDE